MSKKINLMVKIAQANTNQEILALMYSNQHYLTKFFLKNQFVKKAKFKQIKHDVDLRSAKITALNMLALSEYELQVRPYLILSML